MPDEGEANQLTFKNNGLPKNLNEHSYMQLNEESVNVELDTSRGEPTINDDYVNKDKSFRNGNKLDTLEDIETVGQNGAFVSKKSSPPMITP